MRRLVDRTAAKDTLGSRQSVPELAEIGGDAALYAPPDDAAAWAVALRRIVADADLRERLRTAGLERVELFSWDRSARHHADLFYSVAA